MKIKKNINNNTKYEIEMMMIHIITSKKEIYDNIHKNLD